jgi:hypothetical protein
MHNLLKSECAGIVNLPLLNIIWRRPPPRHPPHGRHGRRPRSPPTETSSVPFLLPVAAGTCAWANPGAFGGGGPPFLHHTRRGSLNLRLCLPWLVSRLVQEWHVGILGWYRVAALGRWFAARCTRSGQSPWRRFMAVGRRPVKHLAAGETPMTADLDPLAVRP